MCKQAENNQEFEASYKVLGPTDSKRDGYFVDNRKTGGPCTGRIELETPMGTLVAEVAGDQEFPGFYVSLRRPGDNWEQTVVLVECPDEDVVMVHRWDGKGGDGDDPVESIPFTKKNEKFAVEGDIG